MLSLAAILETSARDRPDKAAIVQGPARIGYRELDARAQAVAADLAGRGIGPGDVVALACPNVPAFPVFYFGVLKAGATVLPVSILLKRDEMAYLLNDSGAKALVCHEGSAELPLGAVGRAAFEDAPACEHFIEADAPAAGASFDTVQRNPDDTAVVLYTSGTTGRPKGRDADPLQPADERPALRGPGQGGTGRHRAGGAAAVPRVRAGGADAGGVPARGDGGIGAPVRAGPLPRPHGKREGDAVLRRADHALGAADLSRRGEARPRRHRLDAPAGHGGRRLDAGGNPARLREKVRCDRTGRLRPLGNLAGRQLQPARPRTEGRLRRPAGLGASS